MKEFQLEISSINFHRTDRKELLERFKRKADELGIRLGAQLHNDENEDTIAFLHREGIPLSAHAPLLEKFNWNFAAEDISGLWEGVENNVRLFSALGVTQSCFHGFYMSDTPVEAFGHGKSYAECMRPHFRPELTFSPECVKNGDFTKCEEYLMRRERVKNNLAELKRRFPGIRWSIETDFPAYGAGSMLPEDMNYLQFPLCIDTGHLWCICKLFNREFHTEVGKFLAGGRVEMVHLHASVFNDAVPAAQWGDGHRTLDTPNVMDLPRFVKSCAAAGVRHFAMEIFDSTPKDLELLVQWLRN